jgi:hypothetical protein
MLPRSAVDTVVEAAEERFRRHRIVGEVTGTTLS